MRIGMIGLGRMGLNMTRRLLRGDHEVVAYNRTPSRTEEIAAEGAQGAFSLSELVEKLETPRILWLMLPAGDPVEEHIRRLGDLLTHGDTILDGGNTYYKDDLRRAEFLAPRGIRLLDVGVSGGVWGLTNGFCLMVGGEKAIFHDLEPLFHTLAPRDGVLYCGGTGAGHFVKMVHNGIEYAMMQAYGEGFQILEASPYGEALDYARVSHLWNRGSVIRSWLLELAEAAFEKDPDLGGIRGIVEDSGEGRWSVEQAIETGVSAPVIALSLMTRFRSRGENALSDRLVAALRREFGGHGVVSTGRDEG